jgi:enediyne biosynthesis protein E4
MHTNKTHLALLLTFVIALATLAVILNQYSGNTQTPAKVNASAPAIPPNIEWLHSEPLKPQYQHGKTLFRRLSQEDTGIDMVHPLDLSHPLKRLYDAGYAAGGVALGDVDNDGFLDIFFSSGPRKNKLYRQVKNDTDGFHYEDITAIAGVTGAEAWSAGAVMVDIDGDDDLDIYVCNYDTPNHLFINDGKGYFTEQAKKFGLAISDASLFPAFADYDNDGDLDCYLLTNKLYHEGGLPKTSPLRQGPKGVELLPGLERYYRIAEEGTTKGKIRVYGRHDYLFQNNGQGKFTDVTHDSGIFGDGQGLSVTWCDFNRDGWIDIYVANDGIGSDRLYANDGKGSFHDVAPMALPHTTWFSMGSEAGDLNNDGQFDLFVLDMSSTTHYKQKTTMGAMNVDRIRKASGPPQQLMRNALFINSGTGRFRESAYLSGLANSNWSWAPKLADFDCDGRLDIFISNGVARNFTDSDLAVPKEASKGKPYWDHFETKTSRPEQNLAFRNLGKLNFDNVSTSWGVDHTGMSYGSATGDLDNDGDLDLVVINLDEPVSVYQNQSKSGHRITIRLKGRRKNTYGLGALVAIKSQSGWQIRQLSPMTGFTSSNDPRVSFGLGSDTLIESLVIQWPGGTVQNFINLPVNKLYTITQSESNILPKEKSVEPPFGYPYRPIYRPSNSVRNVKHRENIYDDFSRQPLLPNKLSTLGPALAMGDVNGDGLDDLLMSGAAGSPSQLYINHEGKYIPSKNNSRFNEDRATEDMGVLLFDADGDDDLDLYIVSGGYEFEKGAKEFRDRLYINDGKGNFKATPDSTLPNNRDSGSCVIACDFDRDGDLDLYIGGRMIPGQYPLTPNSRLLRNDSTKGNIRFTDVTDTLAPGLRRTGMVTSALWSDIDNDGWLDLLVAHEWGPVKVFCNIKGRLEDRTIKSGTDKWKGWWNGITGRDIDGDGDIDYVVTNTGLNTKYHASISKPAILHYGDFDGSGKSQIIEAYYEGKSLFPIRGKSCTTHAIPHLQKLFPSYHKFAKAELSEIFTPKCLKDSHRNEATTLESSILLNDGSGNFSRIPLPRIAQIAPAFGVAFTEINGDGFPDLYLVQNFSESQPETGALHGGLSQILLGSGNGYFKAIKPNHSGIIIPNDARSLLVSDFNGDNWPDLIVGINDNNALAFQHQGYKKNRVVKVRLHGASGNRTAVGTKVSLELDDGQIQTAEVYAGDGYLSQSSPILLFGMPHKKNILKIKVRWPDGFTSEHKPDISSPFIIIKDKR